MKVWYLKMTLMVMLGKPGFFICSSPFENLVTHSWCQLWLEGGWYLFVFAEAPWLCILQCIEGRIRILKLRFKFNSKCIGRRTETERVSLALTEIWWEYKESGEEEKNETKVAKDLGDRFIRTVYWNTQTASSPLVWITFSILTKKRP